MGCPAGLNTGTGLVGKSPDPKHNGWLSVVSIASKHRGATALLVCLLNLFHTVDACVRPWFLRQRVDPATVGSF